AVDEQGNAYVTGSTNSGNFPVLSAAQPAPGGGDDAFVSKLTPLLNALVYSTYLGGTLGDYGMGIGVDAEHTAYVTGSTSSGDFPREDRLQDLPTGLSDAFVTDVSADGLSWEYSTLLGGSGSDAGAGIAVLPDGTAYVTGVTASADFPVWAPAFATYR